MSNETTETVIKTLNPYLSTLADTSTRDRPVKRRAIEAVKKETLQIKTWTNAETAACELLDHLIDSLLVCTESAIESVREQTVGILDSLIEKCQKGGIDSSVIEKLLKKTLDRLKQEPTEEIRVAWMDLCVTLTSKLKDLKISVAESELVMDILQTAAEDGFSEVIKRAAKLIILYAQTQSKATDYACERMIRLTIPLLVHKHTAVRVSGIKSMEAVLLASAKGLHLLFEYEQVFDRQPIVPALTFDHSPLVRDHLFKVLANLLCHWSPRDRYQYGERILPIILSGIFDELPSVQVTCKSSLNQVGQSCTRDLFEADIIHEIPTDDKISETTGLKQLVHICFDKSLVHLLVGSTDFITVRQMTALDALGLFLEYAQVDDLVKNIKKIIHYLMVVYINNQDNNVREKVFEIIALLGLQLPSADIYLDVLLSRLDQKYLISEINGFTATQTVLVVMVFLLKFMSATKHTVSSERVLKTIEKPYLKQYIEDQPETVQHMKDIQSLLV